jgi:urease accessory protein
MKYRAVWPISVMALAASSLAAFAHTGVDDTHGFMHGLLHPIGGLDHTLAMVAVGLFAVHLGGRALWLLPATFVLIMTAGGILGMNGVGLPYVEVGIAASVIAFGVMLASGTTIPVGLAMGIVGFFAIFHGHAHGAEMPASASGLSYAIGFVMATAALHGIGIGIGLAIVAAGRTMSVRAARISGGAIALAGVGLLAGWL